jgi:hypothetical protein
VEKKTIQTERKDERVIGRNAKETSVRLGKKEGQEVKNTHTERDRGTEREREREKE